MLWLFTVLAWADPATERAEAAAEVYEAVSAGLAMGTAVPEDVYQWSRRLRDAQLALGDGKAAKAHVNRMETLAKQVEEQVATGVRVAADQARARYYVAEAKLEAQQK